MDLQAILDSNSDDDSSSDIFSSHAGGEQLEGAGSGSHTRGSNAVRHISTYSSSQMGGTISSEDYYYDDDDDDHDMVDLENILQESSSDEDGDAEEYVYRNKFKTASSIVRGKNSSAAVTRSRSPETYEILSADSFNSQTHTAEDWAVLQAILGEEDDTSRTDDTVGVSSFRRANKTVDAILDSEDEESDSNNENNLSLSLPPNMSPPSGIYDIIRTQRSGEPPNFLGIQSKRSEEKKFVDPPSPSRRKDNGLKGINEALSAEASRRAMSFAQTYEKKLLKAGHREIVSPLMVKRRLKPKIELSARFKKKRKNSTDRHSNSPRYNFSGIVDTKTLPEVSGSIEKHSDENYKHHCGLPTCLSFNSKFIAVGTQKGIILLYDLFEVLRRRLGGTQEENWNPKTAGHVSSVDLSFNGELVIAGYSSGIIVLWDAIKGVLLRTITEQHPSPVTSVRFFDEMKVVTVDAAGLVNKHTFSKNIIFSNYSIETECLLDGTAGQILAMNILMPFSSLSPTLRAGPHSPLARQISLIALSSDRSSFAVAVSPQVTVLHRWPKPSQEVISCHDSPNPGTDKLYLPCLSWGWSLTPGARNVVTPILARAWGCCLQFLRTNFPSSDEIQAAEKDQTLWPAFGVLDEIDGEDPILAIEWLNERTLVYLTASNELNFVDTVMMILLERLDFSGIRVIYAEFSLSRTSLPEANEGMVPVLCSSLQNSLRTSDDRLMIVCEKEVKCISTVSARERVASLEEDGEWLEALALALDHYESVVISQEDRKRDPAGIKDLSKHPSFRQQSSNDGDWISKLLIRYMNLAVDNAPEHTSLPATDSPSRGKINLAQSHFQMLAGVCVEFCVVTRRLDLLFGSVFRRFQSSGFTNIFLDVLEPYILNEKLVYIAPEVMAHFVEYCKLRNGIATVERCLLHMDCTVMDFDSILALLKKNEMYSALFFVFNQGLDDYVTPLEIVLEKVFDEADAGHILSLRKQDGTPQNEFERLGYKAILYLQTCFQGRSFPQETAIEPDEKRHKISSELIEFLFQERYSPCPQIKRHSARMFLLGERSRKYPYLRLLLQVDARALFECLSIATDKIGDDVFLEGKGPNASTVTTILASILIFETSEPDSEDRLSHQPIVSEKGAINSFLDFAAHHAVTGRLSVSPEVAHLIFRRLADRYASAQDVDSKFISQTLIMDLLGALPFDSYEPDRVLSILDSADIHRAALLLHQQVVSSWTKADSIDHRTRTEHFGKAIDCFVEDEDPDFQKGVFDYIRKECSGSEESSTSLQSVLLAKFPALVRLQPSKSSILISELFSDQFEMILDSLAGDEVAEFLFFRAVFSEVHASKETTTGTSIQLTTENHNRYLELMAKRHPETVYDFLSTNENYQLDVALKICQKYRIADASAYLLERKGNVSSALQLVLQTLESRLMSLKRAIRGISTDNNRSFSDPSDDEVMSKQQAEADDVRRTLNVALDMCERNSSSARGNEYGSQLWFNVLDRLINAKGFLRLDKERKDHAEVLNVILTESLNTAMQRIVSNVALHDMVRKVTSDHSGSSLGDVRGMIKSLLDAYGFDSKVLEQALSIFKEDRFALQSKQRKSYSSAEPVVKVFDTDLKKNSTPVVFQMHGESKILRITKRGQAVVADPSIQQTQKGSAHLDNALSRLRQRRNGNARGGIAFLGSLDVDSKSGQEVDPIVFADRIPGSLGEAVHHGRVRKLN